MLSLLALLILQATPEAEIASAQAKLDAARTAFAARREERVKAERDLAAARAQRDSALDAHAAKPKDKQLAAAYQAQNAALDAARAGLEAAQTAQNAADFKIAWAQKELDEIKAKYASPSPPPPTPAATPPTAAYVLSEPTPLRDEPRDTARATKSLKALDVVRVRDAKLGWFHVEGGGGETPSFEGWIRGRIENLLPDPFENAVWRGVKMRDEPWPLAVKLDVLRKKPRPGFTKQQVLVSQMNFLGKGEPGNKKTSETAAGVKEVWSYPGMLIHFAGDKVVEIERVE